MQNVYTHIAIRFLIWVYAPTEHMSVRFLEITLSKGLCVCALAPPRHYIIKSALKEWLNSS